MRKIKPRTFNGISWLMEPNGLVALTEIIPIWTLELIFGIVRVYLFALTSFSIWTPSLFVSSFPFNNQFMVGLGLASTTHSNLTVSSLLIVSGISGVFMKIGAPVNWI